MMEIQRGNLRAVSLTFTRYYILILLLSFQVHTHLYILCHYYVIKGIFLSAALKYFSAYMLPKMVITTLVLFLFDTGYIPIKNNLQIKLLRSNLEYFRLVKQLEK